MKVLVFDLWADYGHFRKFYTTTSPLTFSFPPPSTVAGILGAIYGVGKEDYLNLFSLDKCKISLKIVNPVRKIRMGINLINTKGGHWTLFSNQYHEPRTQIRTEFLKEPHYRIYVNNKDDTICNNLCQNIKEHRSVYTVSLGLSELIANFNYVGFYTGEEVIDGEAVGLSTPITITNLIQDGFEIEEGKKYFKEKMPIVMNQDRIVERYDDVLFEPDGKTIKAKVKNYWRLENGDNITFF